MKLCTYEKTASPFGKKQRITSQVLSIQIHNRIGVELKNVSATDIGLNAS